MMMMLVVAFFARRITPSASSPAIGSYAMIWSLIGFKGSSSFSAEGRGGAFSAAAEVGVGEASIFFKALFFWSKICGRKNVCKILWVFFSFLKNKKFVSTSQISLSYFYVICTLSYSSSLFPLKRSSSSSSSSSSSNDDDDDDDVINESTSMPF